VISYVIAAHNSADVIESTVLRVVDYLRGNGYGFEVIVIENGSTDNTKDVLEELCSQIEELRIETSNVGLGNAFRKGILLSQGSLVVANADDLPFGFSELENVLGRPVIPKAAIGSKAHPRSEVERSFGRTVTSSGLRLLRRAVLGLRIGDSQGTYVLDGDIARQLAEAAAEEGYIFTTEIAYLAKQRGISIEELPVKMDPAIRPSTVRIFRDSWRMFIGIIRIRRTHRRT
jgi:glycosyltransferase involved in cell wall biosynthesis